MPTGRPSDSVRHFLLGWTLRLPCYPTDVFHGSLRAVVALFQGVLQPALAQEPQRLQHSAHCRLLSLVVVSLLVEVPDVASSGLCPLLFPLLLGEDAGASRLWNADDGAVGAEGSFV